MSEPTDEQLAKYRKVMEDYYKIIQELEQLRKELFPTTVAQPKTGKEL